MSENVVETVRRHYAAAALVLHEPDAGYDATELAGSTSCSPRSG